MRSPIKALFGNPALPAQVEGTGTTGVWLGLIAGFNIVAGFLLDILFAYYFGAGGAMDAFLVASAVPAMLALVLFGSIGYTLLPVFIELRDNGRESEAWLTARGCILGLAILLLAASVLLYLFAKPLVAVLAPGMTPEVREIARKLMQVMAFGLPFVGITALLTSLHNALRRFFRPAIAPIAGNLVAILLLTILQPQFDIIALALAIVGGQIMRALFLSPMLAHVMKRRGPLVSDEIRRVATLAIPILGAILVMRLDPVVDRFLASGLGLGAISHLGYGHRLTLVMVTVVSASIVTIGFPKLASEAAGGEIDGLRHTLSEMINRTLWVCIPLIVLAVLLARPLIQLFFERGAFGPGDTAAVFPVLIVYQGLFIGAVLGSTFSNTFFALKDTRGPAMIGIVSTVVGICLKMLGLRMFGIVGIAGAASLTYLLTLGGHIRLLSRHIGYGYLPDALRGTGRMLLLGMTSFAIGLVIQSFSLSQVASLVVTTSIVAVFYLGLSRLLGLGFTRPDRAQGEYHVR